MLGILQHSWSYKTFGMVEKSKESTLLWKSNNTFLIDFFAVVQLSRELAIQSLDFDKASFKKKCSNTEYIWL